MSSYSFPPDIAELLHAHLATGQYADEDDLLRHALCALAAAQTDDWPAVEVALADLSAGDQGLPLDAAFREIRQRT